MNLQMIGCTHHEANLDTRQLLAFSPEQVEAALAQWKTEFPSIELALVSTCNRVELYAAALEAENLPTFDQLITALVNFREISPDTVTGHLTTLVDQDALRHVYRVASSLESMVIGESQILAQVKQAYQTACAVGTAGPLLHEIFQSALRTAKRVAGETALHRHRVSIPSVAIADLASGVFESFDGKHVLVVGAGDMATKTLELLTEKWRPQIHVVNRNLERGAELASRFDGESHPWNDLWDQLAATDLVISTTAAEEPVVEAGDFAEHVEPRRHQSTLFILDLAVPRDFSPEVGNATGVYLYSLDDLHDACDRNRVARAAEVPKAEKIIIDETAQFMAEAAHRAAAPVITRLRSGMDVPKQAELTRLFQKLPELDDASRAEIEKFADRLVNKMLHPPLESLRDASQNGSHTGLVDAVRRLFKIED